MQAFRLEYPSNYRRIERSARPGKRGNGTLGSAIEGGGERHQDDQNQEF